MVKSPRNWDRTPIIMVISIWTTGTALESNSLEFVPAQGLQRSNPYYHFVDQYGKDSWCFFTQVSKGKGFCPNISHPQSSVNRSVAQIPCASAEPSGSPSVGNCANDWIEYITCWISRRWKSPILQRSLLIKSFLLKSAQNLLNSS